jgi:hypothetical protein
MSYAASVLPRSADLAPDFFPFLEGLLLIFLAIGEWRYRQVGGTAAAPDTEEAS